MRTLVVATLFALGLATLPAAAQQQPVLTITGTGSVSAAPDIATVTTAVETAAPTAAEALAENSAIMAQVFETLTAAGVARKDIQTNQLSVQPEYRNLKSSSSSGEVEIYQYRVRNGLAVRVRDLGNLGTVLDRIVRTGINQIGGIGFGHSKPGPMLAEARKAAMADAIATAELYAAAAGIRLVRVLSVSEYGRPNLGAAMEMSRAGDSLAVPIAGGEQAISTSVNVVWAVEQD
ncbi:MAG: SIMPL domain-containing protein [Pseudomonadota bacterium]